MDYRSFDWLEKHVKFKWESWVAKFLRSGAISPTYTIFYADKKETVSLDFFVHELVHVYQREEIRAKLWGILKWTAPYYFHIRHRLEFIWYFLGTFNTWKAHDKISFEINAEEVAKKPTKGEKEFYNYIIWGKTK